MSGEKTKNSITKKLSNVITPMSFFAEQKRLSAVEKLITEIDIVPDRYKKTEILYLSNNLLTTVKNISQFQNLRILSLGHNNVCFCTYYDFFKNFSLDFKF